MIPSAVMAEELLSCYTLTVDNYELEITQKQLAKGCRE